MARDFAGILTSALKKNNIQLSQSSQEKLVRYLELMLQWNKVFNLTSITDTHEMVYLHLIDSLAVQPFLHGSRLLDVGSGAGLPGIPLAIVNPDQHWVMLDKNSKKTRFMTQAIAELGLTNAEAVHSRCEDYEPTQGFDSILSRAFGTMKMFTDVTGHLLATGGVFIAMKGKYPQEELTDVAPGFAIDVKELTIKGMDIERHVVCLRNKL